VYGWKLHLISIVATMWIPLAADLTSANVADNEPAPDLTRELPLEIRFLVGDLHYNAPTCAKHVSRQDGFWSPLNTARIPTPIVESKFAAFSTNCARWLSRT
jgi:hypothetical protein